ncbi:hypothetical protein SEET0821_04618, partial [Salmonella enterica subsp. enterica serovar Tennessee str. TXSC_TXSC08-21]
FNKYDIIIIQDTLPPLAHQLPVHCVHIDLLQTSPGRAKLTKT